MLNYQYNPFPYPYNRFQNKRYYTRKRMKHVAMNTYLLILTRLDSRILHTMNLIFYLPHLATVASAKDNICALQSK